MSNQIEQMCEHFAKEISALKAHLDVANNKVEFLMALQEGLYEKKLAFFADRETEEFRSVYLKPRPLVSVCIPTYNRSELLIKRCIKSLIRQNYSHLQIIVVGDHLTDDTEYQLAQLHDSRIQFENLKQRGPYPPPGFDRWCVAGTMAINRAMDLAEGDFVLHLDDDDEATVDRIEKLVEAALSTQAEFLWHKFLCESPEGVWYTLGKPQLELGQVTTGSIFYHKYFLRYKWNPNAWKTKEPGDWNRIRKIKFLEPKLHFLDQILMLHYREGTQLLSPFRKQLHEKFVYF
jgi:glycosyltransferase involved in cell wall biosynthesis